MGVWSAVGGGFALISRNLSFESLLMFECLICWVVGVFVFKKQVWPRMKPEFYPRPF